MCCDPYSCKIVLLQPIRIGYLCNNSLAFVPFKSAVCLSAPCAPLATLVVKSLFYTAF